jgi:dephospho-CoA kinase
LLGTCFLAKRDNSEFVQYSQRCGCTIMEQKKTVIGILGGIASGKSTVARLLGRHGCAVIEADPIAHQLLEKPEIKDQLVGLFGQHILDENGRVNRAALAHLVFSDASALNRLNALIHPPVMAEIERQIAAYQHDPTVSAIVLDVPLLAEAGGLDLCDVLVFVDADRPVRLERLKKSGKFDENELKKREKFQISLDKKKQLAHYSVSNNSGDSDLAGQVAQLFSTIIGSK